MIVLSNLEEDIKGHQLLLRILVVRVDVYYGVPASQS